MSRTIKNSITVIDQGEINEISEDLWPDDDESYGGAMVIVQRPDGVFESIDEAIARGAVVEVTADEVIASQGDIGDTSAQIQAIEPEPAGTEELTQALEDHVLQPQEMVDTRSTKQKIEDAELRAVIDRKLREVFQERARGRDLEAEEAETHEAYKEAKKAREAQDKRINEEIDALQTLYLNEPDPVKYPLFDKPVEKPSTATTLEGQRRERVAEAFPAPEAIAPLPAADYPEFLRRKQDAAAISLTGLPKGTIKYLVETLKLETVGALVRKLNAVVEGGARWNTITGWTEKREEQIVAMLGEFGDACLAEWNRDHPAVVASSEAPVVEMNGQAPTEAKPKRSRKPKDAPLLDQAEEAGDA